MDDLLFKLALDVLTTERPLSWSEYYELGYEPMNFRGYGEPSREDIKEKARAVITRTVAGLADRIEELEQNKEGGAS